MAMSKLPAKKWRLIVSLSLVILAYSVIVLTYLVPRRSIQNLDFWYHISIGWNLNPREPKTMVDGFYPLGYPLLLRFAVEWGLDALRVGQFLSWAGGLLALAALFLLVYLLTGGITIAAAASLLLLINRHFLTYATYEGNDMLAAGLQAASVATFCYAIEGDASPWAGRCLIVSSVLLGLAYLTRYTALMLLPIALLGVALAYNRYPRLSLGTFALYLSAFLAVTAVQWVPSWIVYHNPFYNMQAKNVWFGIYGQGDWVNNWNKVPDTISLVEVIALDPDRFLRHWLGQVYSALATPQLWPWAFHIGWIVALPFLLVAQRPRIGVRLVLILSAIFPMVVTAMAWLTPRFLLFSMWMEAVLIAWLAWRLMQLLPVSKTRPSTIASRVLTVLALSLQWEGAWDWWRAKPLEDPVKVNDFLRLAGMEDPNLVATNNPYLHATDDPSRTRYAQTYWVDPSPATVAELLGKPSAARWQFLVMDYSQGFGNYSALREAFRQASDRLAPLALSDLRDIFCVLPCGFHTATPIVLDFGSGMRLIGYRLLGTGRKGALYLYWQAKAKLETSYKVSVRILDAAGAMVFQQDNVPAQWTRPTTGWRPGELIVDFYWWQIGQECPDCRLSLLVYEEATLAPITATTPDGEPVGQLIVLSPLPR